MSLLGFIILIILLLVVIISLPVLVYRQIIVLLAKYFRPDLGEICSGLTATFTNDYFATTPSRTSIVVIYKTLGNLSTAEFRKIVLKKWINRRLPSGGLHYEKFQQAPVRWMGFVFWKKVDDFAIDDHVHRLPDCDESKFSPVVEDILNRSFKAGQSPWEFYVVENYRDRTAPPEKSKQSVVILNIHHCIGDGYSILSAIVEGLCDLKLNDNVPLPTPRFPKRSLLQKAWYYTTFPILGLIELSDVLSYGFVYSPLKVPDHKKKWYQLYHKCDPVLIEDIKDIKNRFGVSFTSVLLSAVSYAISQHIGKRNNDKPIQCLSTLPVPGRNVSEVLINKATGAIFGIPTKQFETPIQRLEFVNQIFEENKKSVIPLVSQLFPMIFGSHLYFVSDLFTKNTFVPMGLTNFPGSSKKLFLDGKELHECGFTVGGLRGDGGFVVSAITHLDHMQIGLSGEEGIISRNELARIGENIVKEMNILKRMAMYNEKNQH